MKKRKNEKRKRNNGKKREEERQSKSLNCSSAPSIRTSYVTKRKKGSEWRSAAWVAEVKKMNHDKKNGQYKTRERKREGREKEKKRVKCVQSEERGEKEREK